MKLIMTLLVRDEDDIIEENIKFHLSQGVDFLIITDNKSVDNTRYIIKKYEKKGNAKYIYEPSDDYSQYKFVTRMSRMAYVDYNADWVINSDADEFWWPNTGNLKSTFESITADINVVEVERNNFVAVSPDYSPFYDSMIYREVNSKNYFGKPLPSKVAHRGDKDIIVNQGNHGVTNLKEINKAKSEILIFHFPIRGYQKIENKIRLGGAAYERNTELGPKIGGGWRTLYRCLQKDGNIKKYFLENSYNFERLKTAIDNKSILEDRRLSNYFKTALSNPITLSKFNK